jgi:hypothetical protein
MQASIGLDLTSPYSAMDLPAMDPNVLHVAVRWLHVVAMAVALGGAALLFVLAARLSRVGIPAQALVRIAALYEWIFWAAAGTLAMTGVGNLGAFGTALPPPQTGWGMTLTIKLGFVVLLVLLSLPRTLAVARLALGAASAAIGPLRALYGTTTAVFGTIAALAVWLAHG